MPSTGTGGAAALRQIPLFTRLDDADLDRVSALLCRLRLPAGAAVLADPEDVGLTIVVDGEVELRGPGLDAAIALHAGDYVGDRHLVATAVDGPELIARTDVVVDQLRAADLRALLAQRPLLAHDLLAGVGDVLARLTPSIDIGHLEEVA